MSRSGLLELTWGLLASGRRKVVAGVAARFAQGLFQSLPLAMLALLVDKLRRDAVTATDAWLVTVAFALCLAGQFACGYLTHRIMWTAAYDAVVDLRVRVLEHLRRLPLSFHARRKAGDTATAFTQDMSAVEAYVAEAVPALVGMLAVPLLVAAVLVAIDAAMAAATLVSVALAAPVFLYANRVLGQLATRRQDLQAEASARIVEYVQGIAVIRAYNQAGERLERFRIALDEYRAVNTRLAVLLTPIAMAFVATVELGIPIVIAAGAYLLFGGQIDAGTLPVFLVLALRVYQPLLAVAEQMETVRLADASMKRIARILDEPVRPDPPARHRLERHDVRFEDVRFGYDPDHPVLRDVSFAAPAGSMTAIVGPSGAGKSTALNLIARFWDPDRGAVRIGGVDVRELTERQLFDALSVVFQDVTLFQGTIAENIAFGRPDVDQATLEQAARLARVHDFVSELPHGYATRIGEDGATLSGGERQRISIARALVKDAPIVLLDEATASIDPTNERLVREALARLVRRRTLIVVAHRLSTIRSADQIVVLDEGRVVELGPHEQLLAGGGVYARFWAERARAERWQVGGRRGRLAGRSA